MWRKCKNLDERQLLQRGNTFQHVVILLFVELALEMFFREEGFVWAEGMWQPLLMIWAALTLGFSEFILREITPMGRAMGWFYTALGAAGAFIVVVDLYRIAVDHKAFTNGYMLTECGASTIEGCLMIFIFLLFLGKKLYNRRMERIEDEN